MIGTQFRGDTCVGHQPVVVETAALVSGGALAPTMLAHGESTRDMPLTEFMGNLALLMLSTGGMYIGGGIAPRILPILRRGGFLDAFHAKGRYDGMLERMAVRVILDDQCALRGAGRYALTRLAER